MGPSLQEPSWRSVALSRKPTQALQLHDPGNQLSGLQCAHLWEEGAEASLKRFCKVPILWVLNTRISIILVLALSLLHLVRKELIVCLYIRSHQTIWEQKWDLWTNRWPRFTYILLYIIYTIYIDLYMGCDLERERKRGGSWLVKRCNGLMAKPAPRSRFSNYLSGNVSTALCI